MDGLGREGKMVGNIGGEVGTIPPYPTFMPPSPKKYFLPKKKEKNIVVKLNTSFARSNKNTLIKFAFIFVSFRTALLKSLFVERYF